MNRAATLGLIAGGLLLGSPIVLRAQQPISVEVSHGTHHVWDPVYVRVKNLTADYVRLVIPVNVSAKGERTYFQLPLDLERLDGNEWKLCPPVWSIRSLARGLDVYPGGTSRFTFGVAPPGRYHVRAWYVVDPGDLGPPKRLPVFASVVSQPFDVLPHEFIPPAALPAMSALALNPPHLCGTSIPLH
jgi:hypothetical protein